jgi:Ca2+-binding RTX toxin-like protein
LTADVTGAADGNDQSLTMSDAQVDGLTNINANGGDKITLSDQMTSDMLDGTTVNGTLTLKLQDVGDHALTLVEGVMDAATDLLKVDATALTGFNELTFLGASETTAKVSVQGGASNDTIVGTSGIDTIEGNAGQDSITGGIGLDSLLGGADNDVFIVAAAALIVDGSGTETIDGGDGTDTINLTNADTYTLTNGTNNISNVEIVSIDSDSAGYSVTLDDAMAQTSDLGGANSGTVRVDAGQAMTNGVIINAADFQSGRELYITDDDFSGSDTMTGGAGNDSIEAGTGNDLITLNAGVDTVFGELGADTIKGADDVTDSDSINGGGGNDRLDLAGRYIAGQLGALTTANLISQVETIVLASETDIAGANNGYQYNIAVDDDNDVDAGASVTDTLTIDATALLADADTTQAGNQSENLTFSAAGVTAYKVLVSSGAANDSIVGGTLSDTLIGNEGNDTILGGDGLDSLLGGDGSDKFQIANPGQIVVGDTETIDGGADDDTLSLTGPGTYTLTSGTNNITNIEIVSVDSDAAGYDIMLDDGMAATSDLLSSNSGTVRVEAGQVMTNGVVVNSADFQSGRELLMFDTDFQGADTITGGAGMDSIKASDGNDSITGNGGADSLYGEAGNDLFVFDGPDAVDFDQTIDGGTGTDRIRLDTLTTNIGVTDSIFDKVVNMEEFHMDGTGNYVVVLGANTDQAFVNGITAWIDTTAASLQFDGLGLNITTNVTGTNNRDTILGGTKADVLSGLGGADSITGGVGNDTIDGGTENDTLDGGAGSDSIVGGGGDDTVIGGSEVDTLIGGTGNDTYIFASNSEFISGNAVVDSITDTNGTTDRALISGAITIGAADIMTRAEGVDQIVALADAGNPLTHSIVLTDASVNDINTIDLIGSSHINSSATVNMSGVSVANLFIRGVANGTNTISGGTGIDTIVGGTGADSIIGNAGADSLRAGGGDDTIVGDQADVLIDGEGHTNKDILQIGAGFEDTGDGQIINIEQVDVTAGGLTVSLDQQTEGLVINTFATGATTLIAGAGSDTVTGGTGNDSITAGTGNDNINAGDGNDTIVLSTNLTLADTINGGVGTDTLTFTDATVATTDLNNVTNIEAITLGDAATTIVTLDTLVAAGATLTVDATGLSNTLYFDGSAEADGKFSIGGGSNNDTIIGGAGDDTIAGNDGNDSITAGAGADSINGGADDDIIIFAGNLTISDTVIGGLGSDTLTFTDATVAGTDLNNVTEIETIILGNADTTITTVDSLVANGATLVVDATGLTPGQTLSWIGSAEADGKFSITGGADSDTIAGGAGNDTLLGGAGADSIVAGNGDNTLSGGAGDDTLTAGTGADSLSGGSDNDTFVLGGNLTSSDTILGSTGTDTLTFTDANGATDDLNNVTGIETITLGDADTTITTVDGLVDAGATLTINAAALSAGSNLVFDGSAETNGKFSVQGGADADTISGGAGDDTLLGGAGADSIVAGNGDNVLSGGAGDDTLVAGAGADSLSGGSDNDTFVLGGNLTSSDTILGSTGTDTLTFTDSNGAADDLNNVTGIETVTLGDADTTITTVDGLVDAGATLTINAAALGAGSNLLFDGSAETNGKFSVEGGADADTITGGAGNDTINSGAGADSIISGAGNDSINGGANDDTIVFNSTKTLTSADTIDGHTGNDTVRVDVDGAVSFTLDADFDNVETLLINDDNSIGADASVTFDAAYDQTSLIVDGSSLDVGETLTVDASANAGGEAVDVRGGADNDTLIGGAGNDTISGNDGNDSITAGAGNDDLTGGNGNDIFVLAGNMSLGDTIVGGAGTDTLTFTDDGTVATDLNNVSGIETITLGNATTNVTTVNDLVANGETLTIDATALTAGNTLTWNGSAEADGKFSIAGGAGNDTITGGSSNDTIAGNDGNDSITAGAGQDSLSGGIGNDTFVLDGNLTSSDTVSGGLGTDTLTFTDANGATDDLDNVSGIETITLGDANTSVTTVNGLVASGATLTVNATGLTAGRTLTWDGSAETDGKFSVSGSAGNDTILGGSGNDTLIGNDGNDSLTAGAGVDSIHGGANDDIIVFGTNLTVSDTVDGSTGTDTLTFTDVTVTGDDLNNVIAIESITLGNADTTITTVDGLVAATATLTVDATSLTAGQQLSWDGSAETDGKFSIAGGADNDTIIGGAGNDTIAGNSGNDSITAGTGEDSINGGNNDDIIVFGTSLTVSDTVDGGTGADTLTFTDTWSGNALDNVTNIETIRLGNADTAITTLTSLVTGTATLTVDATALTAGQELYWDGSAETDGGKFSIAGGADNDTIIGGSGDDTIAGNAGNDSITAGAGADSINGGNNDDIIVFSTNLTLSDTVDGGAGTDRLVFTDNGLATTDLDNVSGVEEIELGNATTNVTTLNGLVAAGATLSVWKIGNTTLTWDGSAETDGKFSISGAGGGDTITGGSGNDTLIGNAGNDSLTAGGGVDSVNGGNNDDIIVFGTNLTVSDTVDGGTGTDTLTFTDATVTGDDLNNVIAIESITLGNADTTITTVTGLVAGTATLTVDATALTAGQQLSWDGSAETNGGKFSIAGGADNDTIIGGAGNDTIAGNAGNDSITAGAGADSINGGDNNDIIIFAGNLTTSDTVIGGTGADTLTFTDNNGAANDLDNVSGIETITLGDWATVVTTVDGLVANGETLTVDATALAAGNFLNWTGSAETDGKFSIAGGAGNDTIIGGSGNDTLLGNGGNDSITGSAGVDSIMAGSGDDVIVGAQDDALLDGEGHTVKDVLQIGAAFNDVNDAQINRIEEILLTAAVSLSLDAQSEAFTVTGSAGNDTIVGSSANDTINGLGGDDSLTGGVGIDSINAGSGDDTIVGAQDDALLDGSTHTTKDVLQIGANFDDASNAQIANIEEVTLTASGTVLSLGDQSEAFTINGSSGNDTITAGAGNDTIIANGGADSIVGGTGVDSINAGAGNDTIVGADDDSLLDGGDAADTDLLQVAANFTNTGDAQIVDIDQVELTTSGRTLNLGLQSESLVITGFASGSSTVIAGSGADTITGGTGTDSLSGGTGADSIMAAAGDDIIVGAQDDVLLDGGTHVTKDVLQVGANFNDTGDGQIINIEEVALTATGLTVVMDAQSEALTITGFATGTSTIKGGSGADTITGGTGADSIDGNGGNDSVSTGAGNDTIVGAAADALLDGGADSDILQVGANFDDASNAQIANIETVALTATGLTVSLADQTEAFVVTGFAAGASTITGGAGADTITGGSGADSLVGGTGADSINAGAGNDTIVGAQDDTLLDGDGNTDTLQIGANFDDTSNAQIADIEEVTLTASGTVLSLGDQSESFTINGSSGNDTITAGAGNDTIIANGGADSIVGGTGVDSINAGAGNDTIVGAQDDVLLDGGDAGDTDTLQIGATFDDISDAQIADIDIISLTATGLTLTLSAQAEGMTIQGFAGGSSTIVATSGADSIVGGVGNDSITGGSGVDTIDGGQGSDTYYYAANSDFVSGAAVIDSINDVDGVADRVMIAGAITIAANTAMARAEGVEQIVAVADAGTARTHSITINDNTDLNDIRTINLSGSSNAGSTGSVNLTGVGIGVAITGVTAGSNTLTGGGGVDTITGGSAADTITGGAGADVLDAGTGNDTYVFSTNAQFVSAGAVVDNINDAGGTDIALIVGNITIAATDDLSNAEGIDKIVSGTASGAADATARTHSIVIDNDASLNDVRTIDLSLSTSGSSTGSVNLTGVTVNMTITGVANGTNTLIGGSGIDTIYGGDGADTINGGASGDTIDAGAGADLVIISSSAEMPNSELIAGGTNIGGLDTLRLDTAGTYASTAIDGATGFEALSLNSNAATWNITLADANFTTSDYDGSGAADGTLKVSAAVALTNGVTLTASAAGAGSELYVDGTNFGGDDSLTGGAGADTIFGGAGADTIAGGAGADSLIGGTGDDVYVFSADVTAGETLVELGLGGTDTLRATTSVNFSNLAAGDLDEIENVLVNNGAYTLTFTGAQLDGEIINFNEISGSNINVDVSVGSGLSTNLSSLTFTASVGDAFDDGSDIFRISGAAGNETITGTTIADSIVGAGGADSILGGDGADTINGGAGVDEVFGQNGNDVLLFANGAELNDDATVDGGAATDTIRFTSSTTDITDDDFDNVTNIEVIQLAAGGNTASFGTSAIAALTNGTITGGTGADIITTDFGAESITIDGGDGNDSIDNDDTDVASDSIAGGNGNDSIWSGGGNDTVHGGANNDSLSAEAGDDLIIGGTGADTMIGGTGIDTFQFSAGHTGTPSDTNFDVITDFVTGTDIIDYTNANISVADDVVSAAGRAGISSGEVTFDAADDTLAERITAVQAAIQAGAGHVSGESAVFNFDGDSYLFISDGTAGVGANDVLVKISGFAYNDLTVAGGDITGMSNADATAPTVSYVIYDNTNGDGDERFYISFSEAVLTASNKIDTTKFTYDDGVTTYTFASNWATGQSSGNPSIIQLNLNEAQFDLDTSGGGDAAPGQFAGANADNIDFAAGFALDTANNPLALTSNVTVRYAFNLANHGAGITSFTGSTLDDTITGSANNDTIDGNTGNDSIVGGNGADSLVSGGGADTLTGGSGADTFVYTPTASTDAVRITDFDNSTDYLQIDLSSVDAAFSVTDIEVLNGGGDVADADAASILSVGSDGVAAGAQNIIQLTGTTFASAQAAADAIEVGGTRTVTGFSAKHSGDAFMVIYTHTDGSIRLALARVDIDSLNDGVPDAGSGQFENNQLTGFDMVIGLTGITSSPIDFIA